MITAENARCDGKCPLIEIYEIEIDQGLSEVPLTLIASAHSSNVLQEMGSYRRRDAEFSGRQDPNLLFKRLVTSVRIGRDVHEILHFWRTDVSNFIAINMVATLTS